MSERDRTPHGRSGSAGSMRGRESRVRSSEMAVAGRRREIAHCLTRRAGRRRRSGHRFVGGGIVLSEPGRWPPHGPVRRAPSAGFAEPWRRAGHFSRVGGERERSRRMRMGMCCSKCGEDSNLIEVDGLAGYCSVCSASWSVQQMAGTRDEVGVVDASDATPPRAFAVRGARQPTGD
jgi:hypothetical protein